MSGIRTYRGQGYLKPIYLKTIQLISHTKHISISSFDNNDAEKTYIIKGNKEIDHIIPNLYNN